MSKFAIICVVMLLAVVVPHGGAADCRKVTPAANVNENFVLKMQPSGGFFAPIASGEDSPPKYTPKPMPMVKGSKKFCLKEKIRVGGLEVPSPPFECQYNKISEFYCVPKLGSSGVAFAAAGLQVPKTGKFTVVDTDNNSYMAWSVCMDGAQGQWIILATDPDNTKISPATIKALGITKAEVEASQGKRIKPSRTAIEVGDCQGGGGGNPLGGVSDGLSGLFG